MASLALSMLVPLLRITPFTFLILATFIIVLMLAISIFSQNLYQDSARTNITQSFHVITLSNAMLDPTLILYMAIFTNRLYPRVIIKRKRTVTYSLMM